MAQASAFHFLNCWRAEAANGACDEAGFAEYRRLLALWVNQGRPVPVREWIRREANRPPEALRDGAPPGD